MKQLKLLTLSVLTILGMTAFLATPALAAVYNPIGGSDACDPAKNPNPPDVCKDLDVTDGKAAVSSTVQNVIDILFYVIGVIAVIMIIVGGIKYVTSNGDSSALTSAKNTILYAIVGLVVALLSYGIVKFVLNQF